MKKIIPVIGLTSAALFASSALHAQIWTVDFTGFTAPTNFIQGVGNYTYEFDGDGNAAFDPNTGGVDNVKALTSGLWAKAGGAATVYGFNDRSGNIVAQPNEIGNASAVGMGVVLDSSLFTDGAGTYRLTYDLIADSGNENRNARVWVGTALSDSTAANGFGFDITGPEANPSTPANPFLTTGTATTSLEQVTSVNLDTSADGSYFLDFTYELGEDVAIVFSTTNTDAAFDNFSISLVPEPSAFGLLASCLAFVSVMCRRRR